MTAKSLRNQSVSLSSAIISDAQSCGAGGQKSIESSMEHLPSHIAQSRAKYARLYKSPHRATFDIVNIPADITVLTRDPAPCGFCGSAGVCRHRPYYG